MVLVSAYLRVTKLCGSILLPLQAGLSVKKKKKSKPTPPEPNGVKALSEEPGILLSPSSLLSPPVLVRLGEVATDLQDAYCQVDSLSTANVFPADLF